jgi:hypothetical protein
MLPTYRRLTGCLDLDVCVPAPGTVDLDAARAMIGWPTHLADTSLPDFPPQMAEDLVAKPAPRRATP